MGLTEKRAVQQFKDSKFPSLKKEIDQAAGFEVPVEVKWDTLAADGYSHLYDECFPKVYFTPLCEAFKEITKDQMGKDALKGSLKKIVLANTKETYDSSGSTFDNGVLEINLQPCTNVDEIDSRKQWIQELVESKL